VTWGLSGLQWTIGLLVLAIALRRAIPGYAMSRRSVSIACAGAVVATLAITGVMN